MFSVVILLRLVKQFLLNSFFHFLGFTKTFHLVVVAVVLVVVALVRVLLLFLVLVLAVVLFG